MRLSTLTPTVRLADGNGDERALSPIAGIVLMVALTVTLAALIGSLVVAVGVASSGVAPAASFEFTHAAVDDGYRVTATHTGGTTFTAENTRSLALVAESGQTATFDGRVVAGRAVTVGEAEPVPADTVVRVVWTAPGGRSQALATDRTPA